MKFTTILLDADIWVHRACVVASTKAQFGDDLIWTIDPRQAGGWIRQELAKLRTRLGAKKVIMALGDRGGNFRKELDPTYKANRKETPKPPGFREVEENLRAKAQVRWEPRLEGDDILGLLATKEPTEGKVIVSIDKDLLQIPGTHYNPDKDEITVVDADQARMHHLHQTLVGDRVDGYPGLPGCGPVKAAKILAGDTETAWERVVAAYEKAGQTEEQALLQAHLAFVLRQGYYDRKTNKVKLWTPE